MKHTKTIAALAMGLILALAPLAAADEPIFVKWLVVDDPGDETIRTYWQRAEAGELSPNQLVDLGTMLFYRGWSKDAIGYFKQALDADHELAEAWFRVGLVKQDGGDLSGARSAYRKCLKIRSGHGWANFYLGLLEEQSGNSKTALKHFEKAFEHAPELADPRINPEILSSQLQLAARVRHYDRERFEGFTPMPYLDLASVHKVRRAHEPRPTPIPTPVATIGPKPTPTPVPRPTPTAGNRRETDASRNPATTRSRGTSSRGTRSQPGSSTLPSPEDTPFGFQPPPDKSGTAGSGPAGRTAPKIGDTSPEASLGPASPVVYRIAAKLL